MEQVNLHMQESDAFAWCMEKDPLLRSTIVALVLLADTPDWDRVLDRVDRVSRLVPGFRQRVVITPLRLATPRWAYDPDFDLSCHLRRTVAASPNDLAAAVDLARQEGARDFDRARPLWEFTLIEGLKGQARSAFLLKLHHSLTDGIGGMQLARLLFDSQPLPSNGLPLAEAPEGEHLGGRVELVRDALAHDVGRLSGLVRRGVTSAVGAAARAALHPRQSVGEMLHTAGSVARTVQPLQRTLSPIMTDRRMMRRSAWWIWA